MFVTNPLKYTCLFGGGAIRGLAYVGTIRALEELDIEYDIIGGSSVGSIIAALVACGYKSYEIENLFMKVNFDLFKDIHLGIGKPLALSKGEIFLDWLNELLKNKITTGSGKCVTFNNIEKPLVIITTDLTKFCSHEFSTFKTPDFEVARAIKVSSSMPGLMAPFEYNGSYLVDGDLQKASPMWRLSENINNSESRILEFRLEGDYNKNENNPISYINTIYSCVTDVASEFITDIYGANDRYDCISINTGDIFFADFNLNKDARRKVINLGYEQTIKYFKEFLPEKKKRLSIVYSKLVKFFKKMRKGVNANNVEDVQFWLGDIFTLLCENKEIVDPNLYTLIHDFKEEIVEHTSKILFFHAVFKNQKDLEKQLNIVIETLEQRVAELQLYIQLVTDFNTKQEQNQSV